MAVRPEQFPGTESKWDIPHIARNDSNMLNAFCATFKLSPTLALPGNWLLWGQNKPPIYAWDIDISSDTAIEFTVGTIFLPDPLYTQRAIYVMSDNSGPTPVWKFEAQVAAATAFTNSLTGGFTQAGGLTHIFGKTWFVGPTTGGLYVTVAPVVANVYVTFWFTEMSGTSSS